MYAINKQLRQYFDGREIAFLSEKLQLLLVNYLEFVCTCTKETTMVLEELEINPGSTSDSIVQEITENLSNITNQDIETSVKTLGYAMSLNRLMGYQIANLGNIEFLGTESNDLEFAGDLKNKLHLLSTKLFSGV